MNRSRLLMYSQIKRPSCCSTHFTRARPKGCLPLTLSSLPSRRVWRLQTRLTSVPNLSLLVTKVVTIMRIRRIKRPSMHFCVTSRKPTKPNWSSLHCTMNWRCHWSKCCCVGITRVCLPMARRVVGRRTPCLVHVMYPGLYHACAKSFFVKWPLRQPLTIPPHHERWPIIQTVHKIQSSKATPTTNHKKVSKSNRNRNRIINCSLPLRFVVNLMR